MIKHIVMWKFREGKEDDAAAFLDSLRHLYGVIPEILQLQAGQNLANGEAYDAALIADFHSTEELEHYRNDPRHVAVLALYKDIFLERTAMDIEI